MIETTNSLARFHKPFFATEFGGGHEDRKKQKLDIEHASGAWLALVCGHADAPMLWWREWVDPQEKWAPYGAIRRFLVGEDLRGADARSLALKTDSPAGGLWCRAWARLGRILIYVQDRQWSVEYKPSPVHEQASVVIGDQVAAGNLYIEWWDADTGQVVQATDLVHAGGRLVLGLPRFQCHLAGKLLRR